MIGKWSDILLVIMADSHAADFGFRIAWSISVAEFAEQRVGLGDLIFINMG